MTCRQSRTADGWPSRRLITRAITGNARSIPAFVLYINNLNSSIEPIGDRLAEHDMAVIMLKAVIATRIPTISPTASDEYTAPPANRKFLQPPPNPNHLRSLSLMADHFNRNWEQQIESGLITARRAAREASRRRQGAPRTSTATR